MPYIQSDLIFSEHYNGFIARIDAVLYDLNSKQTIPEIATFGYGQGVNRPIVLRGDLIDASETVDPAIEWTKLIVDINTAREFQTGLRPLEEEIPFEGDIIDIITQLDEELVEAANKRFVVDEGQLITGDTPGNSVNAIRATDWTGQITHEFTVTATDWDELRYFFNASGEIRITPGYISSGTSALNDIWVELISGIGDVVFNYDVTSPSGVGIIGGEGSDIGFYDVNVGQDEDPLLIYNKTANDGNQAIAIYVRLGSTNLNEDIPGLANQLIFTTIFSSNDLEEVPGATFVDVTRTIADPNGALNIAEFVYTLDEDKQLGGGGVIPPLVVSISAGASSQSCTLAEFPAAGFPPSCPSQFVIVASIDNSDDILGNATFAWTEIDPSNTFTIISIVNTAFDSTITITSNNTIAANTTAEFRCEVTDDGREVGEDTTASQISLSNNTVDNVSDIKVTISSSGDSSYSACNYSRDSTPSANFNSSTFCREQVTYVATGIAGSQTGYTYSWTLSGLNVPAQAYFGSDINDSSGSSTATGQTVKVISTNAGLTANTSRENIVSYSIKAEVTDSNSDMADTTLSGRVSTHTDISNSINISSINTVGGVCQITDASNNCGATSNHNVVVLAGKPDDYNWRLTSNPSNTYSFPNGNKSSYVTSNPSVSITSSGADTGPTATLKVDGRKAGQNNKTKTTTFSHTRISDVNWNQFDDLGTYQYNRSLAGQFGESVAISGDGQTFVAGAPNYNGHGAAIVYIRVGDVWQFQKRLQAADKQSNDLFGYSVAISKNGNDIVVGAPIGNNGGFIISGSGAAYIYVRTGTNWTQQQKVTKTSGNVGGEGSLGYRVDISGDGNTILVGFGYGFLDAPLYKRNNGYWSLSHVFTLTGKISPYVIHWQKVALSEDAKVVMITRTLLNFGSSGTAIYTFQFVNGAWQEVDRLGESNVPDVAMSGDGLTFALKTSVTGVILTDNARLHIWVRPNVGTTWIKQTIIEPYLGVTTATGYGKSLDFSYDGDILIVGSSGATTASIVDGQFVSGPYFDERVLIYVRKNNIWSLKQTVFNGPAEDKFGWDVALSRNGSTAVIGIPEALGNSNLIDSGGVRVLGIAGLSGISSREIDYSRLQYNIDPKNGIPIPSPFGNGNFLSMSITKNEVILKFDRDVPFKSITIFKNNSDDYFIYHNQPDGQEPPDELSLDVSGNELPLERDRGKQFPLSTRELSNLPSEKERVRKFLNGSLDDVLSQREIDDIIEIRERLDLTTIARGESIEKDPNLITHGELWEWWSAKLPQEPTFGDDRIELAAKDGGGATIEFFVGEWTSYRVWVKSDETSTRTGYGSGETPYGTAQAQQDPIDPTSTDPIFFNGCPIIELYMSSDDNDRFYITLGLVSVDVGKNYIEMVNVGKVTATIHDEFFEKRLPGEVVASLPITLANYTYDEIELTSTWNWVIDEDFAQAWAVGNITTVSIQY